jgi:hypothetical protein
MRAGTRNLFRAKEDRTPATFITTGIEFVERLGTDPRQVAASLIERISEPQRQEWSKGTVEDWATEAFALTRRDAYGLLPHSATTAHTRFRRHMPSRLRRMSHFNSAGRAFGLRSP